MDTREFIFCASDELQEKTSILSDHIWDAAETAFTEVKSAAYMKEYLASEGFTIESGVADIPTAFTATYGSGRPHIGLLAEYDALSGLSQEAGVAVQKPVTAGGNGHGCGHNLLGAGCAHAGVLIKRYLAETGKSGTVTVFGCPAEEGGSGKTRMAGKGVFAGLDCALSWHPGEFSGVVPVSTMANIQVNYRFHGKASHAASSPYMGRSALDAVELMNVGSNYLREHIPPGCMLHYAVLNTGGSSPNVVQAEAESTYLIRGAKVEDAAAVKARVDKIAQGAALMTETEVEIIFEKACSHYMPNSVLGKLLTDCLNTVGVPAYDEADLAFANAIRATTPTKTESSGLLKKMFLPLLPAEQKAAAEQLLSAEFNTICFPAVTMRQTVPGSTDVGDVSLNCPVSWFQYVTCAQGTPSHSWQMVAQGKSAAAHKGTVQAGKIIALAVVRLLEDETILPRAWEEFRGSMGGKRYVCPIPDEYNKLNPKVRCRMRILQRTCVSCDLS